MKKWLRRAVFAVPVVCILLAAGGTGGHLFAETLDQHNQNVANWRKIRREKAAEEKKAD